MAALDTSSFTFLAMHACNALAMIFVVNAFGSPGLGLGYAGLALFESGSRNPAFNFILKSISPSIIIVIEAAILYSYGLDGLVRNIFVSVYIYFTFRLLLIFFLERERLVDWPMVLIRYVVGVWFAHWIYENLISDKLRLVPDLNAVSNELWIIIGLFIYKAANSSNFSFTNETRAINGYIEYNYHIFNARFGEIIKQDSRNDLIELAVYSIMIFENYNRSRYIRFVENLIAASKTKGIMQNMAPSWIDDLESTRKCISDLNQEYLKLSVDEDVFILRELILSHNNDNNYLYDVLKISEITALRVEPRFKKTYLG